jgi:hypothetical protein
LSKEGIRHEARQQAINDKETILSFEVLGTMNEQSIANEFVSELGILVESNRLNGPMKAISG